MMRDAGFWELALSVLAIQSLAASSARFLLLLTRDGFCLSRASLASLVVEISRQQAGCLGECTHPPTTHLQWKTRSKSREQELLHAVAKCSKSMTNSSFAWKDIELTHSKSYMWRNGLALSNIFLETFNGILVNVFSTSLTKKRTNYSSSNFLCLTQFT